MTETQRYELSLKLDEMVEAATLGDEIATEEIKQEALDMAAQAAGGMKDE